jgi:hypothetical protein
LTGNKVHWFLVAAFGEEPRASAEHHREDPNAQLVDQVVLHQRVQELNASGNVDLAGELLLQRGDLVDHVPLQDRRVVPLGFLDVRRTARDTPSLFPPRIQPRGWSTYRRRGR